MSGAEYSNRTDVDYQVVLNVYDLHEGNSMLGSVGLGIYHTGVEINGKEYSFSASGVCRTTPKLPEFGVFKESITIGSFKGLAFLNSTVASLAASDFLPGTYDIVNKNCNNFSNALCVSLCNTSIPSWINRAASIGSTFSAITPTDTSAERAVNKRYSSKGQSRIKATEDAENGIDDGTKKSSSIFSWLMNPFGGKSVERSVVHGDVTCIASSERKELTDKQKALLEKVRTRK